MIPLHDWYVWQGVLFGTMYSGRSLPQQLVEEPIALSGINEEKEEAFTKKRQGYKIRRVDKDEFFHSRGKSKILTRFLLRDTQRAIRNTQQHIAQYSLSTKTTPPTVNIEVEPPSLLLTDSKPKLLRSVASPKRPKSRTTSPISRAPSPLSIPSPVPNSRTKSPISRAPSPLLIPSRPPDCRTKSPNSRSPSANGRSIPLLSPNSRTKSSSSPSFISKASSNPSPISRASSPFTRAQSP